MAATHIGQIEDTPLRTLAALRNSDLLIFEEEKPARLLLKQAGLRKPYITYNEHRSKDTLEQLRDCLKSGKSAVYVSDQGSPTLADPGCALLQLAYSVQAQIKVIPGPSSVTAAISACPFKMDRFLFHGFLPADNELRERELLHFKTRNLPIILLDTPYRLEQLLMSCSKILGSSHKAFLALDISGDDECYAVDSFKNLLALTEGKKLNFVLILKGLD
jgi:16S rRNA (cytidine1402-2'-O)-methyltransferase